jgi:hypothetical protein
VIGQPERLGSTATKLPQEMLPRSVEGGSGAPILKLDEVMVAFAGVQLRGRWFTDDRYRGLRNAAWAVRNSRTGQLNNPVALQIALAEVMKLIDEGEQLRDIIEALAELLIHP